MTSSFWGAGLPNYDRWWHRGIGFFAYLVSQWWRHLWTTPNILCLLGHLGVLRNFSLKILLWKILRILCWKCNPSHKTKSLLHKAVLEFRNSKPFLQTNVVEILADHTNLNKVLLKKNSNFHFHFLWHIWSEVPAPDALLSTFDAILYFYYLIN